MSKRAFSENNSKNNTPFFVLQFKRCETADFIYSIIEVESLGLTVKQGNPISKRALFE